MHAIFSIYLAAIAIIICLALYLLPALIAVIRRAPDITTVVLLNILLGWTLIGWVASLAIALRKPVAPTSVQVISQVHLPRDSGGDRAA